MPVNQIIAGCEAKMKKTVEVLKDELKGVRGGKASTGLVENLRVDYYGTPTPLKQLAALATPQPDSIVIKPFDPGSVKEIEKAIKNSDLSIAPIVEGKIIRLSIPPLSEERRRQIVQQVKQLGEQAKIGIRNVRRDEIKLLEKEEDGKLITEDDLDNGKKKIDDLTKEHTNNIEQIIKNKSDEIIRQ
jgi:ribosome recycling factor